MGKNLFPPAPVTAPDTMVTPVSARMPGARSPVKTTSIPGVFEAWLAASSPLNATRRSEAPTAFHCAAASFTWLRTELKLSVPEVLGATSVT